MLDMVLQPILEKTVIDMDFSTGIGEFLKKTRNKKLVMDTTQYTEFMYCSFFS